MPEINTEIGNTIERTNMYLDTLYLYSDDGGRITDDSFVIIDFNLT